MAVWGEEIGEQKWCKKVKMVVCQMVVGDGTGKKKKRVIEKR